MKLEAAAILAAAMMAAAAGAAGCAATMPWVADPSYDDALDAHAVRARLSTLRIQKNSGPTSPSQAAQVILDRAKVRVAGGSPPEVALEHAFEAAANETERDTRWWMLTADTVGGLRFPADLVAKKGRLNVAIAVFRQTEGHAPLYLVTIATPSLDEYRKELPFSVGQPSTRGPDDSSE